MEKFSIKSTEKKSVDCLTVGVTKIFTLTSDAKWDKWNPLDGSTKGNRSQYLRKLIGVTTTKDKS